MSFHLIADENVPADAVVALRARGHNVVSVRSEMPGCSDIAVLKRAQADGRLVLTFDKDFGELAIRFGLRSPVGVILFRVTMASAAAFATFAVRALESREDWPGHFAVIEESRIRMTTLPTSKGADR